MLEHLEIIKKATALALEPLERELTALRIKSEEAQARLQVISQEMSALTERKAGLLLAQDMQLSAISLQADQQLSPAYSGSSEVRVDVSSLSKPKTIRARIGPQRYLILSTLHENPGISLNQLIEKSGVSSKRVKEQVRVDHADGFIDHFENQDGSVALYHLSAAGGDLLSRFVNYRQINGIPLPTLEDAGADASNEEEPL